MNKLILESYEGGEIDVFPVNRSSVALYQSNNCPRGEEYIDLPLRLNEETFYSFAYVFLNKHLNQEMLSQYRNVDIEGYSFDSYGDNLCTYSDVQCMLTEMTRTAREILFGKNTNMIKEMIQHLNPCIYKIYGSVDKEQLFDEHRNEIADYLLRFCDRIQLLMEQFPEHELLNFQGP